MRNLRSSKKRPLRPVVYLTRNFGKTLPLTGVIVLAVMLIVGIISMMNSIPLSIRSIYAYSKSMLAIGPRGDMSQTPKIMETIKDESPIELDRMILCRASPAVIKSIVGKWPFVVLGMQPEDARYYLKALGAEKLEGRIAEPGKAEVVISEPIARNLKLKLGDALLKPTENDYYSPYPVVVVGIAQTDKWIMLNDFEYQKAHHFPPIDNVLVFAKDPADQPKLGVWAEERFKGERAAVFAYHILERDTNSMFDTLYKVLNVVIGTLVFVITIMMGMLINIYITQRVVEFGLLQAIGYTKQQLVRRVLQETMIVLTIGWIFGVIGSYFLLSVVKARLFYPNAYYISTADPEAFLYSIPVPVCILLVAVLTIIGRFRKFDPVSVVERRLV